MFTIRTMIADDYDAVMSMVDAFYQSPAVDHKVEREVLEETFRAAVNPEETLLRGILLEEDGSAVGFGYITECYSCEAGGRCVFFEELYFKPECRGKGYGTEVFHWVKQEYPNHPRIRLEVTDVNANAIRLYERLGFRFLDYRQMILEGDFQD